MYTNLKRLRIKATSLRRLPPCSPPMDSVPRQPKKGDRIEETAEARPCQFFRRCSCISAAWPTKTRFLCPFILPGDKPRFHRKIACSSGSGRRTEKLMPPPIAWSYLRRYTTLRLFAGMFAMMDSEKPADLANASTASISRTPHAGSRSRRPRSNS